MCRCVQRRRGRFGQVAGKAGGHHHHPIGTQRHRLPDGGVVGDAPVDQQPALVVDRSKHRRDGGTRQNGGGGIAAGERHLLPAERVGGDDVQGQLRISQVVDGQMRLDQPPKRSHRTQRGPLPRKRQHRSQRVERKDILAAQAPPQLRQVGDRLGGVTVGAQIGGVECPRRGSDQQVGPQALLLDGGKHARLNRSEASASRKDERCGHRCTSIVNLRY